MIAIIAAFSKNRIIGDGGRIPWDIPHDMQRFKKLTTGNIVIMGRITYEDIGRPLPDRYNIIVTSDRDYVVYGCKVCASYEEALQHALTEADKTHADIFICGGASIYKQALADADKLCLSILDDEYEGDRYFPEYDESMFECVYKEHISEGTSYTYYELVKTCPK